MTNILQIDEKLDQLLKLFLTRKKALTFNETCQYTSFSPSYLYKLTASKKIPHSKPNGKVIFFDKDKLDSWMLQNEVISKHNLESKALAYTLNKKR